VGPRHRRPRRGESEAEADAAARAFLGRAGKVGKRARRSGEVVLQTCSVEELT
jgi:hypothetical protein